MSAGLSRHVDGIFGCPPKGNTACAARLCCTNLVPCGLSLTPDRLIPQGLRSLTEDGELKRGDREILPEESAVVQRIFAAYLDGESPNKIADMPSREGVSGPRGGKWDKSTIHGNPKRGTGIRR